MKKIFFSAYVWFLIFASALLFSLPFVLIWLFTFLFDKRLILLNDFAIFWGSSLTVLVPGWKVKVIGKEKLDYKSKIIIANHQSQEDVLLMYRLGVPFRWISKEEVFKTPLYGWLMYLKGDVKLQRSSKISIKQMFADAEKVLRKGCIITIFPEGTRSKTGKSGNFKEGAFKLAQAAEIPIVPVVIYGTGTKLIYPNGIFKGKHKVVVKVLDEIPYSDIKGKNTVELASQAKEMLAVELKKLKISEDGN